MKRNFLLIIFVFTSIFSFAQFNKYSKYTYNPLNFELQCQIGNISPYNAQKHYVGSEHSCVFGFAAKVCNVYVDFGCYGSNYTNSASINIWKNQRSGSYFHGGFNIDIFNWLSITPLIGKYTDKYGYVDGHNWWVSSSDVVNKFVVLDKRTGLDYGGQLSIHVPIYKSEYGNKKAIAEITASVEVTKHIVVGCIGFNTKINKIKK